MTQAIDILKGLKKRVKSKDVEVTMLSDDSSPCIVSEFMPTGCAALDSIMGGGLPVGRITELYGDNSTGKSLVAAHVAAMAQYNGNVVLYIDTESAVSIDIMKKVGVDVDNMIYSAPDTMEEAFELMEATIVEMNAQGSDQHLLIVWDSIAATSTETEMGKDYGNTGYLDHARVMSQAMRKLGKFISKEKVCALFINQTREKIGVMFGDKTATFGGKAVSFYASVRIQLRMGQKIKTDKRVLGIWSRATCTKNKVAEPFHSCSLPIYFGQGINDTLASFIYLKDAGLLTVKGPNYVLNGNSFTKATWPKYYNDHYDEIAQMILGNTLLDKEDDDATDVGD